MNKQRVTNADTESQAALHLLLNFPQRKVYQVRRLKKS